MARKFLTSLDLQKNELQNAKIQNLATAPSSPTAGQIYYDTVENALYYYDGSSWQKLSTGSGVTYGSVTAQTSYGLSSGNGSATTVSRSDHTHGTPSLTSNTPTTQAVGDSAVVGTGTLPARDDHKHAMPAFGSVTAQTSFGASSGNGSSANIARADHTHGTPTHDNAAHSAVNISALAAAAADVSFGGYKITNLATPVSSTDAATKGYVDAAVVGIDWKPSVRAATTANITLSGTQTVDGVSVIAGDRVLVKNQNTGADNGIYVAAAGAWSRSSDADTSAEVTAGMAVFVEEGTSNADSGWVLVTDNPITLGTTALTFTQFTGLGQVTAGDGLTKTGNTLNVGAGTGITVAADSVAVDTSVVARKYSTTVGDNASVAITVTHNLGTRAVVVSVYDSASPYNEVECDVEKTTTNTITLRFTTAPTTDQYTVAVVG